MKVWSPNLWTAVISLWVDTFLVYLFFWLHWIFVAASMLSLVVASRGSLSCAARVSHCESFSCCGAQTLGAWAW